MPQIYSHKRPRERNYTNVDVKEAAEFVRRGLMSYRQASKHYNIPYGVVYRNTNGTLKRSDGKQGRPNWLPTKTEHELEALILARSEWGYPMNKKELYDFVQSHIKGNNINCYFKDGRPSQGWYQRFMREHPCVSLRKPNRPQKSCVDAPDPFVVNEYFDKLGHLYNTYQLHEFPHLV